MWKQVFNNAIEQVSYSHVEMLGVYYWSAHVADFGHLDDSA